MLGGQPLAGWQNYSISLNDLSKLNFKPGQLPGPAFYRANVSVEQPMQTFLDMRGWGKGYVWVNSHNLGRYWSVGPQRSLYVPAEWLRQGLNEFVVLDLEQSGIHSIEGRKFPIEDTAGQAVPA